MAGFSPFFLNRRKDRFKINGSIFQTIEGVQPILFDRLS